MPHCSHVSVQEATSVVAKSGSSGGRVPGTASWSKRYIELATAPRSKVKSAATPALEKWGLCDQHFEQLGELTTIAAEVLMHLLRVARAFRLGLFQPETSLAREVSRWSRACEKALFRLVYYIN